MTMPLSQPLWLNEQQYSLIATPMETERFGWVIVSSRHLSSCGPRHLHRNQHQQTSLRTTLLVGRHPIQRACPLGCATKNTCPMQVCVTQDLLHSCIFSAFPTPTRFTLISNPVHMVLLPRNDCTITPLLPQLLEKERPC